MKATVKVRFEQAVRIEILAIDPGSRLSPARVKIQHILGNDAPVTRWYHTEDVLSLNIGLDSEH